MTSMPWELKLLTQSGTQAPWKKRSAWFKQTNKQTNKQKIRNFYHNNVPSSNLSCYIWFHLKTTELQQPKTSFHQRFRVVFCVFQEAVPTKQLINGPIGPSILSRLYFKAKFLLLILGRPPVPPWNFLRWRIPGKSPVFNRKYHWNTSEHPGPFSIQLCYIDYWRVVLFVGFGWDPWGRLLKWTCQPWCWLLLGGSTTLFGLCLGHGNKYVGKILWDPWQWICSLNVVWFQQR